MRDYVAYIGIDQSYTGFAAAAYVVAPDGHVPVVPMVILRDFSKAKSGGGVDRLLLIEEALGDFYDQVAEQWPIEHICMEGYSHGSQHGREQAGELAYAVKRLTRYRFKTPDLRYPTIVQPTVVKKFATGNGGAPKSLILKEVFRKWGVDCADDNIADAYVLARIAAHHENPGNAERQYERDVLNKLTWNTERPPPPRP